MICAKCGKPTDPLPLSTVLCGECFNTCNMMERAQYYVEAISNFDWDEMVEEIQKIYDKHGLQNICEVLEQLSGAEITVREWYED